MDNNQSYLKNRFYKVISLMVIGLLLAMELTGFVSAGREGNEEDLASEATAVQETIAQWIFKDKGENGVFPATGGVYQTASSIRDVGTNTNAYTYESGENSVRNQGWHEGTGLKYWLATLSTKGFEGIFLSSQQTSSSTGPRDFKVQYSIDQQEWTDVTGGNLVLAQNNFNCSNNSCKLTNLALPAGTNNQDVLYIRWVVNSAKSVSGERCPAQAQAESKM